MKISYICPTNYVRRPISELSSMLANQGDSIIVAYPFSKKYSTKGWAPNIKIETENKVQIEHISSWYISSLRYNITKPLATLQSMKRIFKSDIVHLWEYWYPLSVFVILYAFITKQRNKLIMTTDGIVGYSYNPKKPWWLVPIFKIYTKTIGQLLFKIPIQLTTYGKSMLPYAKKARFPMNKLSIYGTGINISKFNNINVNKIKKLKKGFNIKETDQTIIFVGMLTERKGISTVIKVAKMLLEKSNNIKILIVGDAHGPNIYLDQVQEKYKDKIIFTGGRTDIPELMKLADCLLLPSEGEGLPGVVMEAMAAGTACVATNEGCTPDLIDSGVNGFLVEHKNVEEYTKAVRNILNNPKLYGDKAF